MNEEKDIKFELDRYIKSIENTLNAIYSKDGYVQLDDLWAATSLPKDLMLEIIRKHAFDNVNPDIKGVKYKNKTYNIKRRSIK